MPCHEHITRDAGAMLLRRESAAPRICAHAAAHDTQRDGAVTCATRMPQHALRRASVAVALSR